MKTPVNFDNIEWESPKNGVFQKSYTTENTLVRLVRFTDKFIEDHWCTKAHKGYVIEGVLKLEFETKTVSYQKGDVLIINSGEVEKHKISMDPGSEGSIILFEETEN